MLTIKSFLKLTGIIFFIVGLLHLIRLFTGIELILGTQAVPLWVSMFGVLFPWYISFNAFTLASKGARGQEGGSTRRSRRRR